MSALWKSACSRAAMLAVLLSIAPSALWASAAFDPNTARGFAGKAYQLGELDNVNLFNGNLTVRLPLGQSYTAGPSLSYSFVLTANTKVWDYRPASPAGPRMPIPETLSNAGMGWNLHLGKLVPPSSAVTPHGWLYIGPDGAQHELKGVGPVFYTDDGSYLRLHLDPLLDGSVHWVHFPDGTRAEFHATADAATLRAEGSLRSIGDRFENYIAVAYSADTCDDPNTTTVVEKCAVWTITDGHGTTASGRSHVIRFANKVAKYGAETDNYHQVISSVELASFDSATRSIYTFHYQDDGSSTPTEIPRKLCDGGVLQTDPTVDVPLLASVTLPDQSAFSMEYLQNAALYGDCNSGSLRTLTTPTGGKIEYEYGDYESTLPDCNDQDYWMTSYGGVTKRKFYRKASDAQPEGVWTYTSRLTPRPDALSYSQNCSGQWTQVWEAPEEMTTTVVDPVGNKTVHYFSVYPKLALASHSTFKAAENGLPLSRRADPLATGGLWLSSESYEGATLKRRTFVTYDTDPAVLGNKVESQLKKRRVYDVTDTGCSGACYVETANDQYDLNGHYKETVTSSNLPGSITRKSFTNYTPAVSAWLLNLYDEVYVTEDHGSEGWKTRKTISAFDNLTGALLSTRILRATSGTNTQVAQSGNDILTLQCRDTGTTAGARGFVTSERHFGGDLAVIPGNVSCSTVPASNSGHYVINHAYTFSGTGLTGHTAQYAGTSHLIADEVFDPNTGKVKTSRDSAGIATSYVYDKSGRLTAVKPAGEASTTYKYEVTSNPPALTIRNCPAGSDSCDSGNLTEAKFYFDGLGRLTEERRRMPLGQWSALWNTYDALGRTKKSTVPVTTSSGSSGADSSTANTTWDYDFAGRVTRETRPDTSTTQFAYTGIRQKTISITHPGSSTLQLRSTEQYDGGGHLLKVIQPSGPTSHSTLVGADVPTEYKYDIGDRLRSVKMTGTESGTPQTRTFTYDGAGFLTGEVHPESGTVSYIGYDARGHAQKRLPSGAPTIFKQQYTYDAAERLTQVDAGTPDWTGSGAEYRPQKAFTYSTASDSSKGRLLTAVRHNYPICTSGCGNNIRVTETYGYDSVGRKNSRTTVIDDVPASGSPVLIKSISQSFSYNALGLPDAVNYPTCSNCGVPPGPDPARNVALIYSEGMLQSVGSYVSSMGYGATGAVTNVAHGNGIGDAVALDTTGRPQSITFNTWSSCGTPAKIESQPGDLTVASGSTAIIQVPASGTSLSFQLYEAVNATTYTGATPIGGPTTVGNLTTPTLTATKFYYVRVSNACKSENTRIVTVTVTTGCTLPTINTSPSSQNITSGTSITLTVTHTGGTSFQWYQGYTGDTGTPVGTNSSSFLTPQLYATTRYWVRVSNSCGSKNSLTAKITIALPAPTNLVASKVSSSNQVKLTWSPSAGAAKYEVWRRWGSASYSLMDAHAQSPWYDQQAIAGKAYVYKVRAVDVDNLSESPYSNNDIAMVTNFTPIVANTTVVDDAHLHDLLTALNAVRAAKTINDPAWQWSDILPAGVPAPAPGGLVLRKYIEVLRTQFTSALQGLDLPAPGYTDASLVDLPFRAIHLTEIQERAK